MPAIKPPHLEPVHAGDFLAKFPFFQGISQSEIMVSAGMAQKVCHKRGQIVFNQGDVFANQFMLLSGEVKIVAVSIEGERIAMRYVGPGELFGGLLYESLEECPVTAIAAKESSALCWSRSGIHKLLMTYPRLSINLVNLLGLELARLRNRFQELATERIEQRVARALVRLVDQAGRKVESGVLIDFPVSRQDLAELTGTTLYSVSRILAQWERMGILESGRQKICIRNPHGLMVFAEDFDRSA